MDGRVRGLRLKGSAAWLALAVVLLGGAGCRAVREGVGLADVRPKSLRDVPAGRLAFRFEPDVAEEALPEQLKKDETEEPLASVRADFEGRRGNTEALLRTVVDPTGQRALALYGTSESDKDFRIDLYSVDGLFIRNILPPDLTGVFPAEVAWSPDGQHILFAGVRNPALTAKPTPRESAPAPPDLTQQPAAPAPEGQPTPEGTPTPTAPIIPSTQTFTTEQVYVGNRDGFELRPLTSREGLIYFKLRWSPDGQAVAALACKEEEYDARLREGRMTAGRPRLVMLDGQERLLDDRLTEVPPVFSPDASKVATAFDYEVAIYDAFATEPTAGAASVAEQLRTASVAYDERLFKKPAQSNAAAPAPAPAPAAGSEVLASLNPFIRLEWTAPETIYGQTAFVHFYSNDPLPTVKYLRWHALRVSPQAVLLGG
ncbi:MAG TPA: hypothetical protein VGX48_00110 [Pyrinomonadaceae bacterium]|jgi:hypothetical protein|nr:hypothetical protein [Pyrinomonadaceae bacterium]